MATQQTISQSLEQSKLAVVPFPAPEPITQLEIAAFLSLRARLHQIQDQVSQAKQPIKARLETGGFVAPGDRRAELKENFRRNVAWKAVVIRLAERLRLNGETHCAKVLNSTKSTRTVSVVIE